VTVVSNTGPVIAPAKIDQLGLLKILYSVVQIAPAVHGELMAKAGPEIPRIDQAPRDFLQLTPIPPSTPDVERMTRRLGPGEQEAIALAVSSGVTLLLIDDRAGRRAVEQPGPAVSGVAGVLIRAKQDGLIPAVRPMLEEIRRNGYWLSDALIETAARFAGE
jgi:predicted nucleic acid-binding protein